MAKINITDLIPQQATYAGLSDKPKVNSTTIEGDKTGAYYGLADGAAITAHVNNKSNPHEVTKAQVGLGNVDNTSDASKPISTATQTALDAKITAPETGSTGQFLKKTDSGTLWASVTAGVQSVNGQTGAVVLDAEDVGAMETVSGGTAGQYLKKTANGQEWADVQQGSSGQAIVTLTATEGIATINPTDNTIYTYTAAANDNVRILTTALTSSTAITFDLVIIQPSAAVSFTLPSNIKWGDGEDFSTTGTAPDLSTASYQYRIRIMWDGTELLGYLYAKKGVTA